MLFLLHTNSESDSSGSQTVEGLYTPIIVTEVACSGTEQGLTECNYQEIGPDHDQCSSDPQEATVSCAGMRTSYYGEDLYKLINILCITSIQSTSHAVMKVT